MKGWGPQSATGGHHAEAEALGEAEGGGEAGEGHRQRRTPPGGFLECTGNRRAKAGIGLLPILRGYTIEHPRD